MSRCAIPLLAALLFSASTGAAPVPAQPKPDDSVSSSATKLLQYRKIQKELKMTAEQRVVIYDELADIDEEYDKKTDQLARMPNPPEEAFEKLEKERQKATEKVLTKVAEKNLTAVQRGRLRQLDWRLRGAAAFTDPQVEKKLQLTDAQKKKASDIAEQLAGEVNRYIENQGDDGDDKRKADLFSFRKERLKEMLDTLTADQKTTWTDMLGEAPTGFVVDDLWLKVEQDADASPIIIGK
jgi:hypothetical protein